MSFKRDGDDANLLKSLQKRRVSELFSEGIPEDEALLMKNGRYACMVCPHRPIFDTVNILAVHRNGKKHTKNAEKFFMEKADLEALKLKRRHEEYVQSGKTVPEEPMAKSQSLLHSLGPAYDPRVKKQKVKHGDRKPRVQMHGEELDRSSLFNTDTTLLSSLPGQFNQFKSHQRNNVQSINDTRNLKGCPLKAGSQVTGVTEGKDLCKKAEESKCTVDGATCSAHTGNSQERADVETLPVPPQTIKEYVKLSCLQSDERLAHLRARPYISKRKVGSLSANTHHGDVAKFVSSTVPSYQLTSQSVPTLSQHKWYAGNSLSRGNPNIDSHSNEKAKLNTSHQSVSGSVVNQSEYNSILNHSESTSTVSVGAAPSLLSSCDGKKKVKLVQTKDAGAKKTVLSTEKRQAAEKYLQAIGAGWKRDRGGNWIKDEDVEFDSDEEPPDIP